jgi:AcrR family transcriptional regulator
LSEQACSSKSRREYRLSKRAELMEDTRRRIIEAAVDLHGTVGPAGTTISGIAARAGVTRVTVYRHFPDEDSLFGACSAHWFSQQRVPDPESWAAIDDPATRVRAGLADLYRFYRQGEPMLLRIRRDLEVVPESRRQAMRQASEHQRDVLLAAFGSSPRRQRLRAVLGHALSFWTWHSLCTDNGLSNRAAVDLMTGLVLTTAGLTSAG